MFKVIKNKGKIVRAYQLGSGHAVLKSLTEQGKIKVLGDGRYEVFSQEARNGGSGHGQLAERGDWIKIDSQGCPYPNKREYFEENHRHVEGDIYEQLPKPLPAWTADCGMCKEVEYLMDKKGLRINRDSYEQYYSAQLWGTREVAARDAVLIFYSIAYDQSGQVADAEFNFVEKGEFERTYERCGE